jgi:hypothetical protein
MTGAVIMLVYPPQQTLSVVDIPGDVSGFGNTGAAANITTGVVEAIPSGGVAPYTYAWTQETSSPYTWAIGSPTAASTTFTCNTLGPGTTAEESFRCTVTDARGSTASAIVTAFANNGQPYDNRVNNNRLTNGRDFL